MKHPVLSRRRRRRHPAVRTLQEWLIEAGEEPGRVDGIFGGKTDRAVRRFQTRAGLTVDGIVGRNTWGALKTAVSVVRAEPPLPEPEAEHRIVPRNEWGARPPRWTTPNLKHRPVVYIHHAADPKPSRFGEDAEARKFQNGHMDTRGWSDLAYNFLVTPSGRVLEGRGWGIRPGATRNHNSESVAVCFMGYFHKPVNEKPSAEAIAACVWLIRQGIDAGWLTSNVQVLGHRNVARTACPGDHLFMRLGDIAKQVLA